MHFSPASLHEEVCRVFRKRGVPEEDAALTADVLIEAELEGLGSHGLGRLPIYLSQLDAGGLNPTPRIQRERTRPAIMCLQADRSLGPVAAMEAVKQIGLIVREVGSGCVAVRGAGHVGPLSFYVKRLSDQGLVALAMANTPPAMAPWGGGQALLGTNPIAFSVAAESERWVADLALSVTARGKILQAARAGEPIPKGWAVDAQGRDTEEPRAALEGAILPAGGAKGYALALIVEVLGGILGGGILSSQLPLPWEVPEEPSLPGFFLQAWDPSAFGSVNPLLDQLNREVKEAGGRLPGLRRVRNRENAEAEGIRLSQEVQNDLSRAGLDLERCRKEEVGGS